MSEFGLPRQSDPVNKITIIVASCFKNLLGVPVDQDDIDVIKILAAGGG